MIRNLDTIAAISTAAGTAGIGIVRISGEEALGVADKIFRAKSGRSVRDFDTHTVHYGTVHDGERDIDEALLIVMRAPKSYTTEDIVEIDCHGGMLVLREVLDAVICAGARLAEPGEFTKRAFLGGRIDLSQAEGVMDIIGAENEKARAAALSELGGVLGEKVRGMREKLIHEAAYIEAALDDPEHYSLDGYAEKLEEKIGRELREINALLKNSENGRIIREGIRTAIVGKPNVGKSSLLNLLSGAERAIVTEIPGTTRDMIEEKVVLGGTMLVLIDTAGIRKPEDAVEKIGIKKSESAIEEAELVLFVVDAAGELDGEDINIIRELGGKKTIVILNKSDLLIRTDEKEVKKFKNLENARVIRMSAKTGSGTVALSDTIKEMFFGGEIGAGNEHVIANARQREALLEAKESLEGAEKGANEKVSEDFIAADLMSAYGALGKITGESVGEDLIDKIFSEFCMGK